MKLYKLNVSFNNKSLGYYPLSFVPFGKFLGFKKNIDDELVAVFEMRIEQGYECYNYVGKLELRLNEEFSWPSEYMKESGPSEWDCITLGEYTIKLVYVEGDKNDIFTLYNGVEIPRLGFGTWLVHNDVAPEVVKNAINVGYIHIDSAQAYGNEAGIKEAIQNSLFKREDLFITSKVQAEIKSYEQAKQSIEESLERLGTDYIDLMLIHCPTPWREYQLTGGYRYEKENLEVWKALSEAYKAGKIRSIGVSNFNIDDIKNIINHSDIKPMVNQIPIHLGNVWKELIDYCRANQIAVESYSPLAHARLFTDENRDNVYLKVYNDIRRIPELKVFEHSLNAAQTYLSYASSYSDIILPKASSLEHMLDNMKYLVSLDDNILRKMEELFDKTTKQ